MRSSFHSLCDFIRIFLIAVIFISANVFHIWFLFYSKHWIDREVIEL